MTNPVELSPEAKAEIQSAARQIRADYGPTMFGKVLEEYGIKKPAVTPETDPNADPEGGKPPPPKDPPVVQSKRGLWWTPPPADPVVGDPSE